MSENTKAILLYAHDERPMCRDVMLRARDDEEWSERIAASSTRSTYKPNLPGIERDHAFLSCAREAGIDGLILLAQSCVNGPAWRQVVVVRALARMKRSGAQAPNAERRPR